MKMWHKNCGGKVKYQKPLYDTNFEQAGFCLTCEQFPIAEEDIIFEQEIEKFKRIDH